MFGISGVTQSPGLDSQLVKSPSFGKDRIFSEEPSTDKVSLSAGKPVPDMTYQHLATRNRTPASEGTTQKNNETNNKPDKEEPDRLDTLMLQVLDAKMGIDRKKLEEIEKKIEALLSKEGELTQAEKTQLEILQKQKEQLIKESAKKLTEQG
ncbi:hypothetical protein Rhein_2463 [Rheinheimera sp. A13L]|uniref:hypothetical protein n=1 Tax=Rheinheimera sp. A13L TaxID=506534 RepID=UPI000212533C|nr:hypothetical protein [Rheinheimera sp. A13L]EGM77430.1 hypothetical protein Rhein_2463 [Rheinheimera sp. A13L]